MLRLSRKKNREIVISFREKNLFFKRDFSFAFALALAAHLLAILLIQVHSNLFPYEIYILPAQVIADLSESTVKSTLAKENSSGKHPLQPPLSSPIIPKVTCQPANEPCKLEKLFQNNPFSYLEESWDHLVAKPKREVTESIVILASGELSERIKPFLAKKNSENMEGKVVFEVQVDDRTGQIFWKKMIEQSASSALNMLADQIVTQLQFEAKSSSFITAGNIEIIFLDNHG